MINICHKILIFNNLFLQIHILKVDGQKNVRPSTLLAQNEQKKQNGVSSNFILSPSSDKYNTQKEQKALIDTNNPVQLILKEIGDASFATFL